MIRIVFPAGMTLSVMNTLVAQLEGADGPLTSLKTEGRNTIATFDETLPKPAVFAVIQPGNAAAPQNSAMVFEGKIIISGEEAHHVANRPRA